MSVSGKTQAGREAFGAYHVAYGTREEGEKKGRRAVFRSFRYRKSKESTRAIPSSVAAVRTVSYYTNVARGPYNDEPGGGARARVTKSITVGHRYSAARQDTVRPPADRVATRRTAARHPTCNSHRSMGARAQRVYIHLFRTIGRPAFTDQNARGKEKKG